MQRSRQAATRRRATPSTVVTGRQIAALSSPLRQALVDAVAASGPCGIAHLAAQVGRPASGLYHHVRALVAAGLLVPRDPPPGGAGRPATQYDVPGRPLRVRYAPEQPTTRAPMRALVGAMTRLAAREFAAAYRPGTRVSGPLRELWASRTEAWLTEGQLARANVLLEELVTLFSDARPAAPGARRTSLVFVLAPVRAR